MRLAGKTPFISGGSRGIRLLRQRNQTLEAMGALFPGHFWTAFPDGSPEYLSQSIREYMGIQVSNKCANYVDVIHPDDVAANKHYWEALVAGRDPGELEMTPVGERHAPRDRRRARRAQLRSPAPAGTRW